MTAMDGKRVSGSDEDIEVKGEEAEGKELRGGDTAIQGGGDTRASSEIQGGGDTRVDE